MEKIAAVLLVLAAFKTLGQFDVFPSSVQVILFLDMLTFSKHNFLKQQVFVKENEEWFEIFSNVLLLEIEPLKLI